MKASRPPFVTSAQESLGPSPSRGSCFLYILPCACEDMLKLGFSRDPLARMQALHHRYFEFFDLDRSLLVETETVRDARALELAFRRALVLHNAPAPLTIRTEAGGHSEWFRGAYEQLAQEARGLGAGGHALHDPIRPWLRDALLRRQDQLYAWCDGMLECESLEADPVMDTSGRRLLRDVLDAHRALEIDLEPLVPGEALSWYRDHAKR